MAFPEKLFAQHHADIAACATHENIHFGLQNPPAPSTSAIQSIAHSRLHSINGLSHLLAVPHKSATVTVTIKNATRA